jgi:hypothetical protein
MFSRLLKKNHDNAVYETRPFFAADELAFYGRLRRVLPKCYIFPNVELNALIQSASSEAKRNRQDADQLVGRRIDFAVFDSALKLMCVIDFHHPAETPSEQTPNEALLKSAGIPYYAWSRATPPSSDQLLRSLSSFSAIDAPRLHTEANHTVMGEPPDIDSIVTAKGANGATNAPESPPPKRVNIFALTEDVMIELTPNGHIRTRYPHIWQRMVRVVHDPKKLEQYLASLSLQDRAGVRAGFPPDVLIEIADIIGANDEKVMMAKSRSTNWNSTFVNR